MTYRNNVEILKQENIEIREIPRQGLSDEEILRIDDGELFD